MVNDIALEEISDKMECDLEISEKQVAENIGSSQTQTKEFLQRGA